MTALYTTAGATARAVPPTRGGARDDRTARGARRPALRVVGAALPDSRPTPAQGPGPGAPARVRALPVAVPARRRPVHPTRSAAPAGERRTGQRAAPTLWADVRPWGDEARRRETTSREAGARDTDEVRGAPAPVVPVRGVPARAVPARAVPARAVPVRAVPARAVPARVAPARRGPQARPAPAPRTSVRSAVLPGAAPMLRLSAVLLVTALLGAAAWLGVALAGGGAAQAAAPEAPAQLVAVAPGETLWEIARAHAPAGSDVRETVEAIAVANALTGGQVQAGQVLEIPTVR